jgi:TRAP-type C4-dicarboxylate transport system substrate-binding protein
MPWGQAAVDALAQGVIDGMETDLLAILTSEVFRWAKYLSLTGHIYAPGIIVMSEAAHDKLTEADKRAFVEAARLAAQNSRKEGDDAEATGLAQLLSVGMKINTDIDKAAFRAALAPAYAKWREQFGDLIERIQAHP